jgi:oligopeptide transport system substrate-binding protein
LLLPAALPPLVSGAVVIEEGEPMNAMPWRADRAPRLAVVLVAALLLLPPAVALGQNEAATPAAAMAQAHVLRIGRVGFADTFDPQKNSASFSVPSLVYEGLTNLDEHLDVVPGAAESWEYSDDGLILTFHLREGLTYNDGSPLTAERFRYAVERDCDPRTQAPYVEFLFVIAGCEAFATSLDIAEGGEGTPAATPGAADLAAADAARASLGVTAVDDRTLEIRLVRPAGYVPALATTWLFYPVPREVVEADPENWWRDAANWVSNGPFAISGIDIAGELADREVRFEPNAHYWGGQPRLETIIYRYFESDEESLAAYRNGELDVSVVPYPYGGQPEIADDPQLRQELLRIPSAVTIGFGLNQHEAPFQDPKVREAFAYGLDRAGFCREVWSGACLPTLSWIPAGVPGHIATDAFAYDPAQARQALAASSYGGPEKLPEITYRYGADDPEDKAIAEWLAANYQRSLGITITPRPTTDEEWDALDEAGTVAQFAWWDWRQDYADPQNWLSLVWSCESGEFAKPLGYCNPRFDTLVNEADQSHDQATRMRLYDEAQQLLIAEAPIVMGFQDTNALIVKPAVIGYTLSPGDLWPGWSTPLTVDVASPTEAPGATPVP